MSFTTFTNIITIIFCLAVLVQSVRMMRSLKEVREGQLDRTVAALDTATTQARAVLFELKRTLSTEGDACAKSLGEAKEIRDELNMMVGIANAMAERLVEAAAKPASAERQREKIRKTPTSKSARSSTKEATRKPAKTKKPALPGKKPATGATKASPRKSTQASPATKGQRHLKVVDPIEKAA